MPKQRREKYHPNLTAIKKLVKKDARSIYYDAHGRLYGEIVNDELAVQSKPLLEAGVRHFWVGLMRPNKGSIYETSHQVETQTEEMIFPEVNRPILLHSLVTKEPVGYITITDYPELSGSSRARSTSIFVFFEDTI